MPSPNATPTPITPPRVPLIDPRTGLIDRAWYLFFLSLNNIATAVIDDSGLTFSSESLIASYDAALQSLTQEVGTAPRVEIGTIASQNFDNVNITGGKISGLVPPLPVPSGGTGFASYAVGDLLYADTTVTLAKLPDVATGNALISGGVTTAPLWGKIGLTTHVSGILPTANGGTDLSSFTSGGAVYATSTTALTTGTLPVGSGGTGQTTFTNGQLLIGNSTGNTLSKATLTAGSNISITNGSGSITIDASFSTAGSTGSVTLAKITALGADGSLTFSNGLITAFTAPT